MFIMKRLMALLLIICVSITLSGFEVQNDRTNNGLHPSSNSSKFDSDRCANAFKVIYGRIDDYNVRSQHASANGSYVPLGQEIPNTQTSVHYGFLE